MRRTDNTTRSIRRVLLVLNCFSPEQLELSAAEISHKTKIPLTTTYRILSGMSEGRLIERDQISRKYRIGLKLYFLGNLYLSTQDMIRIAEPIVKTLNELTNESVFVSVFDKGNEVVVYKEESRHAFRFFHNIGTILPAYATSAGKAFLSELTDAEIDYLYPRENLTPLTAETIRTRTELKRELAQVRKAGVAFSREEVFTGVVCIGAILHDATRQPVAALSIALPIFRLQEFTVDRLATLVKKGASLISFRFGYQDSDNSVHDIQDLLSWWNGRPLTPVSQVAITKVDTLIPSNRS